MQTPSPAPAAPLNRKRLALFSIAGLLLGVACFAYALLHAPAWYRQPLIIPEARQSVRNNLVAAEQAFTEGLRAGVEAAAGGSASPFTYHLYEEDVNRWIAMRREIYPLIDELAPPLLADPLVRFTPGRITLAGTCRLLGAPLCVTVDLDVRYADGDIVLKVAAVRCGSVRLPGILKRLGLDRPINRASGETWPGSPRISGDLASGLIVDDAAWWKNGGFDYRVVGLTIEPGRVDLAILPLARHGGSSRRHESSRERDHAMSPGAD